jgi:hypothetical protein
MMSDEDYAVREGSYKMWKDAQIAKDPTWCLEKHMVGLAKHALQILVVLQSTHQLTTASMGHVAKHFCSFWLVQSTHQLITASMGHITNLPPPGVSNPSNPRRAFGGRHRLLTAGMVHVTNHPYDAAEKRGEVWVPPFVADEEYMAEEAKAVEVGSRCEINPGGKRGEVKFVGKVDGLPKGWWVGVQFDEPVGKNDGSAKGVSYFSCPEGYGSFQRPNNVAVGDYPEEDDPFAESDDEI